MLLPPPQQPGVRLDLADTINRFAADSATLGRFDSIRWSEAAFDRREALITRQLAEVAAIDFSTLSQSARVDAVLLRNDLRGELAQLRLDRRRLAEMNDLLTVRNVIIALEQARWRMEPLDARAAADALATIPALVKSARDHADSAKPSAVTAQRAAAALASLGGDLAAWYDHSAGYTPEFTWWCAKPREEAGRAIDDLARHLREEVAGIKGKPDDPLVGDPIGREALVEALKNECIAYSPEELIAIGEREMAWCTLQAEAAAREMGVLDADGKGDWKKALEQIKQDVSPPGGQAAYVAAVAREAIDFVKNGKGGGGLVTVPPMCEDYWKEAMLSPQQQRTLPFAVYFSQAIGIAAPTDAMSHDDKLMSMRGNNRRFTRIVVPHELIPGHHLQSFMAAREKPYRRQFGTPFYVEGWALYWEMKLWDRNWAKSPQDRLGMLFWRMHRCARITVSLRFHLGEMSPQQMIDALCTTVGHERANATAEVRRYIGGDYGPLYQCGYMVGGKQLRALHGELVLGRDGGLMDEKPFNDAVLRYGPIPIELLRAELTGTPLTIDGEAAWRFADR